jgi:Zn-dependent protease with chaperone function
MTLPIKLHGLYPQAYEHPLDAAALNALEHTAGVDMLVRKVSSWGMERMLRIQLTGSFLRVTPAVFPELYQLFEAARERLDLPICPDLYIKDGQEINAFTAGIDRPVIVLNSGAIDRLDDDELLFVIAHEIGHIKSGHVLYYQIANYLPVLGNLLGDLTLGVGGILSIGVQIALLHWQRTSELTADRAGLLACQNPDTAMRAMMKLAGLPERYAGKIDVKHFVNQASQFEMMDLNLADRAAKYLSIYGSNHPWTVMRAKEMMIWIQTGGYDQVLAMPHLPPSTNGQGRHFCDQCGGTLTAEERFCRTCGTPVQSPP